MSATDLALEVIDLNDDELVKLLHTLSDDEAKALLTALDDPDLKRYASERQWRNDPAGWAKTRLHEELWGRQDEICASVRDNRYTAVPACFGSSKSFTAGRIIIPWWISVHPPRQAMAVTTAPTGDQVRAILWKEVNVAHPKGQLVGRVNLSQWYIGNFLAGMGRKPSNTNPAAFQGLHAPYMLVVIDEADGVVGDLWESVDNLVVNPEARVLAIGNPLTGSGPFYRACQAGSKWNVIRISAFDTPDFTGEAMPRGAALVSRTWVKERQDEYGPNYERDPRYQARVMAIAPEDRERGVIRLSKMRAAARPFEDVEAAAAWQSAFQAATPVSVGIDVGASEGGDQTVCRERRGDYVGRVERWREPDYEVLGPQVAAFLRRCGATIAVVDVVGVGHGLATKLEGLRRAGQHKARIARFNSSEAGRKTTPTTQGFRNKRDQLWWDVGRNLVDAGTVDMRSLSLEGNEGEKVMVELAESEWGIDTKGRIVIEPKADVSARLGHSPDDADALLMSFWGGGTPDVVVPPGGWGISGANPYDSRVAG